MRKLFVIGLMTLLLACEDEEITSPAEQLRLDVERIDAYLAENGIDATKDDSGLRYEIIEEGEGDEINLNSFVFAKYTGTLIDGTVFENNEVGGLFSLRELIPGWRIGLQKIKDGGEIDLYIPSPLGFGAQAANNIPPNSILFFSIDLVSQEEQLDIDTLRIDEYLAANNINAQTHPSGMRYVITNEGSGENPTTASNVKVAYEGRFLETGEVFDSSDEVDLLLSQLIDGWRIGVPLIKEGGSITLYLPSELAYGQTGNPTIGPNELLIFDIDLIAIN